MDCCIVCCMVLLLSCVGTSESEGRDDEEGERSHVCGCCACCVLLSQECRER